MNGNRPQSILSNPSHDDFDRLVGLARVLQGKGISKNTKAAYEADFSTFATFCTYHNQEYMPATVDTVLAFFANQIKKKYSTISRFCVSIKKFHVENGYPSPTDTKDVRDLLKGIRRENGISCDAATPILYDDLQRMFDNCERNIRGRRNQAILLIGWFAALRRSEIVALDVSDLSFMPEGLAIKLHRSKTDQEGEGATVFIPRSPKEFNLCAATFLERYSELLFLDKRGPLFRRVRRNNHQMFYDWGNESRLSEQTITDVVKDAARSIGLNPLKYSSHSLRRGFATQCGRLGIPERFIARQTRHQSMEVLRKYIDDGSIMVNNSISLIHAALMRPESARLEVSGDLQGVNQLSAPSEDPFFPLEDQPDDTPHE